jgi:hypothetical protein
MRACDGGAQPLLGQRPAQPYPELGELCHGVRDGAVHAGADLHHRRVRLQRHAIAEILRQPLEHLLGAERQRPVARIEEHQLLLDPDRELVRG